MSRFSKAYSDLNLRLGEVSKIIRISKGLENEKPVGVNLEEVSALYRGGVVLLSSHIEGYINNINKCILKGLVQSKVPKADLPASFAYYFSRKLLHEIEKTEDTQKITKKVNLLINNTGSVWVGSEFYEEYLDEVEFLSKFASPKPKNIYKLFKQYGYNGLQHDIAEQLTARMSVFEAFVLSVVDDRNEIAHGNFQSSGTPQDLKNKLEAVRNYLRAVDVSVCDYFKTKHCSIRGINCD